MELLHFWAPVMIASKGLVFYFKFSVVFFLCMLNIYLIFTAPSYPQKKELPIKELPVLQAGFNIKNLKGFLGTLGFAGGFLSALITLKIEYKSIQIGKLDQLMEAEREGIRRSIDKDREEHQRVLTSIDNNREELYKLKLERAKLYGSNDRLSTLHDNLKSNISSYVSKSTEPSTKLSELSILDQLIKQDTKYFGEELDSVILEFNNSHNPSSSEVGPSLDEIHQAEKPQEDIKESCIFPFKLDLNSISLNRLEWFESLNGIKKLAVCLILGKGVIFSALVSIIFIFYGNILIGKYDLVNKYPKLAKLIQLRQKFQKYYFKYYCFLILLVVFSEIIFGLTILTF